MNHKRNIIILIFVAALITLFLYFIDSDPAYPNFWHTVFEFLAWTFFISGFLGLFYAGFNFLLGWERKVSKTKNKITSKELTSN